MKSYIVTLRLHLGEYLKSSNHVVVAEDPESAKKAALEAECHNECRMEPDGVSCWDGSEFFYRAVSCREVPAGMAALFENLRRGLLPPTATLEEDCTRLAAGFYLSESLPDDFFEDDYRYEDANSLSDDPEFHRDAFTEQNLWQPFENWSSDDIWEEICKLALQFKAVAEGSLFISK